MNIQGSSTVSSAVMLPKQAAIEADSGQKLQIVSSGSSKGITALASGTAQIGMISSPLEPTVKKLEKEPGVAGKAFKGHEIGVSKVSFMVHPTNKVKKLTNEQVADILTGKIKKWSEVGGDDKDIIVIAEVKGGGVRSMVESDVLNKGEIKAQLKEVQNGTQVAQIASQLPNAFGVGNAVTDKVSLVETSKVVSQPLILVTIGDPTPEQKKVIDAAKKHAPK